MEEGRNLTQFSRTKPKVILDKRFPFVQTLNSGDKGQMMAVLNVESDAIEPDEDGNSIKSVVFLVKEADIVNQQGARM